MAEQRIPTDLANRVSQSDEVVARRSRLQPWPLSLSPCFQKCCANGRVENKSWRFLVERVAERSRMVQEESVELLPLLSSGLRGEARPGALLAASRPRAFVKASLVCTPWAKRQRKK